MTRSEWALLFLLLGAGACAMAWGCGELLRPASAAPQPFAWPTAAWAMDTARPRASVTAWPMPTRVPAGTREVVYVLVPTAMPTEGPELVPLVVDWEWVAFVDRVHGSKRDGQETAP